MTSSSSSGSGAGSQSDDDAFAAAPPRPPAALERPADLDAVLELAQITHFCATFRAPLKLSRFTRTVRLSFPTNAFPPSQISFELLNFPTWLPPLHGPSRGRAMCCTPHCSPSWLC